MVHQPASGDFIQESRSTYSVSNLNSKLFSRNIFAIENMYVLVFATQWSVHCTLHLLSAKIS